MRYPEVSWRDIANEQPEFVQWIEQEFGPLHDEAVGEDEYDMFRRRYADRRP